MVVRPILILLTGPTAVGKTACCLFLAKQLQTVVISADARQCYQQMNIGTAKPTPSEQQVAQHYLIDFLPLEATYSAGKFAQKARGLLEELVDRYPAVIVSGGSGLYIQALCEGVCQAPPVPPAVREEVMDYYASEGLAGLCRRLEAVDAVGYARVDRGNPRRLMRALEVIIATGKPFHSFAAAQQQKPFRQVKIALTRPREELYARIDRRVGEMVAAGLFAEVTALYPYRHHAALQTIGYQEIFAMLEHRMTEAEAIAAIKRNTRRYAKRQLSWLRRDLDYTWFHPMQTEEVAAFIEAACQKL
jgi:tRNA dimethylallyltransferase